MRYVRRCGQALKRAISNLKQAGRLLTGSSRPIGAAYKRATPFRQCGEGGGERFWEPLDFARIINVCGVLTQEAGRLRRGRQRNMEHSGTELPPGPPRPCAALRNACY